VLNRNDHHTLDAKDHDGSMSHLGQKQTSSSKFSMSAPPPTTDIHQGHGEVPLQTRAAIRSVDQYRQGFRHTGIGREGSQPLKDAQ
jgi:hypothetical protein